VSHLKGIIRREVNKENSCSPFVSHIVGRCLSARSIPLTCPTTNLTTYITTLHGPYDPLERITNVSIQNYALHSTSLFFYFAASPLRFFACYFCLRYCGSVAPFMTFVVGQAFDAFAPITPDPPQAVRDALLLVVCIAVLQLIGLAQMIHLLDVYLKW